MKEADVVSHIEQRVQKKKIRKEYILSFPAGKNKRKEGCHVQATLSVLWSYRPYTPDHPGLVVRMGMGGDVMSVSV